MSVTASDIKFYGSASMPEDNSTTSGGAIDLEVKVIFTDISTTDNVTVVSDNAGDTMNITVYGRSAAGAIISETLALNGTTRVVGSNNYERIMKVVLASAATGTITVARDNSPTYTEIGTMEPGILELRRMFYGASADAVGGSARAYYEKFFIKNTSSTHTLNSATVAEAADPSTKITFDLESSKDGTNSVSDRLDGAPSGMLGSFDNTTKTVPGGGLGVGEAIGVWLKMSLSAGDSPGKSTWSTTVAGTTT